MAVISIAKYCFFPILQLVCFQKQVYQENVYAVGKKFNSFKKVARSMGLEDKDIAIISYQSVSKG